MTARKIEGAWHVDFRIEGKRIRRKSPVNNKQGAKEYERQIRARYLAGKPLDGRPEKGARLFVDFAKHWLNVYPAEQNNKPSERVAKKKNMRVHLIPAFGRLPLMEITTKRIVDFKAVQLEKQLSPKTINNQLTTLRVCLKSANEWGDLHELPQIKLMKVDRPDFDWFQEDESEALLEAARSEDHAIIMTALRTGMRIGELIALRWGDIDFRKHKITVRHSEYDGELTSTKSGRSRDIPMTPDLEALLKRSKHLKGAFVFCREDGSMHTQNGLKRVLPRTRRRAGLREVNWHVLRHSFASQLISRGASLKAVQELLGHADIATTMRYAHLAPSALRDAVRLLETPRLEAIDEANGQHLGIAKTAKGKLRMLSND